MSATSSSYPQHPAQRCTPLKRSTPLTCAVLIAAGSVVTASASVMPSPARAEDDLRRATQLASVGDGQISGPFQLGMPSRMAEIAADLKVLLVQNGFTRTDASTDDDTILVALALSVPRSVDDDIARQYDLELLDRTDLPDLGLRIVQFRASGNRPIGPIIADLRNDQRIRRAQQNAQYSLPPQAPPASRLREPPAVAANAGSNQRPTERKRTALTKVARSADRLPKIEPANEDARQPLQVGRVGDVLSGGL